MTLTDAPQFCLLKAALIQERLLLISSQVSRLAVCISFLLVLSHQ